MQLPHVPQEVASLLEPQWADNTAELWLSGTLVLDVAKQRLTPCIAAGAVWASEHWAHHLPPSKLYTVIAVVNLSVLFILVLHSLLPLIYNKDEFKPTSIWTHKNSYYEDIKFYLSNSCYTALKTTMSVVEHF